METKQMTDTQHAAWNAYLQARRAAGHPVAIEIPARELRTGDVLAGGGAITSPISRHPSGAMAAEVDWQTLVTWKADEIVRIHERTDGEATR